MWKREAEPMSMVHCLNSAREKQQQQSHKNQDKYIIHIYSEILNDYQNLYTMKRFVCFFFFASQLSTLFLPTLFRFFILE